MTILKYILEIVHMQALTISAGSKILMVGLDPNGKPALWLETPREQHKVVQIQIYIVGTGQDVPQGTTHVGSFVQHQYVWHVYQCYKECGD